MKRISVGLVGFGTIGSGVVRVLSENSDVISAKVGAEVVLKTIADKDIKRERPVSSGNAKLTTDVQSLLDDSDISVVVELVGGTGFAEELILRAVEKGKSVVTANKALLSLKGPEIFDAVVTNGVDIGFEASVGGGIPLVNVIRESLACNRFISLYGIINGTANYILSMMASDDCKFEDALKNAQSRGYAEADPSYDIDGVDTAHKLVILLNLAYGAYLRYGKIHTEGISGISPLDIRFAEELGYKIKLLAIIKKGEAISGEIDARVHPTMIPSCSQLAGVDGVYNAVQITGDVSGKIVLSGKGAGMMPTASAVVGDIINICRDILDGRTGRVHPLSVRQDAVSHIKIRDIKGLECPYYLRFSALDNPGVLSMISGILGNHGISISSVIQKGRKSGDAVPVVIITHTARERAMMSALSEIDGMDVIRDKTQYIRIEESLEKE